MATLRYFDFKVRVYTNNDNKIEAENEAIKKLGGIEILNVGLGESF